MKEDQVKAESLYHTGVVVDDLEKTMNWLADVAGYTHWTEVVSVDQDAVDQDGEVTIPMKMAYSGADPRLELLQFPVPVWTPADSGVHHIGYWSDDVESDLATLESNGMTFEVKSYNPDGSGTLLWAYAKGPTGPRIELRQPQHGTVHRLLVGYGDLCERVTRHPAYPPGPLGHLSNRPASTRICCPVM